MPLKPCLAPGAGDTRGPGLWAQQVCPEAVLFCRLEARWGWVFQLFQEPGLL